MAKNTIQEQTPTRVSTLPPRKVEEVRPAQRSASQSHIKTTEDVEIKAGDMNSLLSHKVANTCLPD